MTCRYSDLGEEARLAPDLGIENGLILAEVIDADDIRHHILSIGRHELRVHVLAVCKERVLKYAAVLPRIERDIKRTGLHEVLEEVAAVAQLRTQTVRAVGELRDAVEAVDLHGITGTPRLGVVVPQRPGPSRIVPSPRR